MRSSFHHAVVARPGMRRSTSRASASAARRTSVKLQRGSMRTLTWMPREPLVLGKPSIPCSRRTSPAHSATSRTSLHSTPGCGIEVDAQLVGVVEVAAAHRPRVPVDVAEVDAPRPGGRRRWARARWRCDRDGKCTVAVCSHSGRFSGTRFWKKTSPVIPSFQRLSTVGRSWRPRTVPSAVSR